MNSDNQLNALDDELCVDDTLITILKSFFSKKDHTIFILITAITLLMVWGFEGDLTSVSRFLLIFKIDQWKEALLPQVPWRDQLITFIGGLILLVIIPCCFIVFYFKEPLSNFGLGFPPKERRKEGFFWFISITVVMCLMAFLFGQHNSELQRVYPLFDEGAITTWGAFITYSLVYFLFFLSIEFIFRGYMLFGLYKIKDSDALQGARITDSEAFRRDTGLPGPLVFGVYAVVIQMLAYIMWHIAKPQVELWGTIPWGLLAAAVCLRVRSIWPIVGAHWLLSVFTDMLLWVKP